MNKLMLNRMTGRVLISALVILVLLITPGITPALAWGRSDVATFVVDALTTDYDVRTNQLALWYGTGRTGAVHNARGWCIWFDQNISVAINEAADDIPLITATDSPIVMEEGQEGRGGITATNFYITTTLETTVTIWIWGD